jgi:hypothetical protein
LPNFDSDKVNSSESNKKIEGVTLGQLSAGKPPPRSNACNLKRWPPYELHHIRAALAREPRLCS